MSSERHRVRGLRICDLWWATQGGIVEQSDGRRVKLRGKLFRYMEQPKDGGVAPKLLLLNFGVFAAQIVSKDRLLHLGCKVNSLINQGQVRWVATAWKLTYLNADVVHRPLSLL